ncbi:cell wall hydrolase [Devosia naphthalenivorans]|uniref:cell wall hydrolase n=1 Tax=Devosia naphthalenivorans TaxID=2082392 RepID=UPI0013B0644E|nr:cell wall hydrolase [Devosia naphthalenivorans]
MADQDKQDIIDTLIAEGFGEGSEGMRRIAESILNRSDIRGITPGEVVRQPHQFTGFWDPGPAAREAQRQQEARDAAWAAYELAQQPGDPTGGADHYYAPGTISEPYWASSMTPTGEYGGHAFFSSTGGRGVGTRLSTANPAAAPTPQTIGPGAIAQRNQVTPQIPAWAGTGMNSAQPTVTARNDPMGSAAVRAALSIGANQTYAGHDRGGTQSLTGNPAADAARIATLSIGGNQTYAGQSGAAPQTARQPSAFGAFPQGGRAPNVPDRLQPSTGMQFAGYPVMQSAAMQAQRNGVGVGTQLATAPGRTAPVPFQRPSFGMGGPGMLPVNAAMTAIAQAAPVAPRLTMMSAYAPGAQQVAPAPVAQKPPVGAVLGQAANGGFMIQGKNGVMNTTTQNSEYWKEATGQQDRYTSNGDGSFQSASGGTYYDRHL